MPLEVDPRAEFFSGIKAELPILLGVLPFGLIYGALALQAGIPAAPALAMSSIVLAGSAQFVATQLFGAGAPGAIILLTTFVVNLRHVLYSASIAPHVEPLRPLWKSLLAYLLTDEAYAVSITHYATGPSDQGIGGSGHKHWYFLGAGLALWATWQASTATGIYVGTRLPPGLNLDFALPLTFMALARPAIIDRATAAAAMVASVTAVLTAGVPFRLGLVFAALIGILVGLWTERR